MYNSAIEQTTTTTGTGTFSLVAPSDALRISFVTGVGNGNAAWYRAEATDGSGAWEEGWGTVTAGSPDTLTRNVVRSSNANALVTFAAGTKRIYCPAGNADAMRFGLVGVLPTAAGTANARTVAYLPACRVLRPGMELAFINGAAANTGATTLAVDGITAAAVQTPAGAALAGGEMPASSLIVVRYDGSAFRLISAQTPGAGGAWTDLASATTTDIGAVASANVRITGTTTITGLGTVASGVSRTLRFAAALTLTHNGTSLILPGGANITTAADDRAEAVSLGSGNWIVTSYTRADGRALVAIASSANTATTSGTSVDVTGIPAGMKRITIVLSGVSTNGTSNLIIQMGVGSPTTSGYLGSSAGGSNGSSLVASNFTAGFGLTAGSAAAAVMHGVLTLVNLTGNTWVAAGSTGRSDATNAYTTGGTIALGGVADRIRLTTVGGTDTFDAGSMTVHWE